MPTAENLRTIKTFAQLVRYLEDELDWPLEQYGFEDLTFEYAPMEVGLRDEEAAKVRTIHQLRPLAGGQPWGIFFIEFEQKRLPVVVVRRILSHLVIKKRASANRADQKAFEANDLLLITAFGEETSDQREIAFAHFHQVAGDLPTLRVLGWDGADTPLKLASVASTLQSRLRWPNDPVDHEQWRTQWTAVFRHRLGHAIRTANELAEALATLARQIRDAALTLIAHESEQGPLRKLHQAFRTALIHDLSEADFADTYAQTITYGLLTAAISRTEMSEGRHGTALLAENVSDIVPVTNPFLKEMLQTFLTVGGRQGGIDFDELGIQDVVELLRSDETDLPAVLRDFGNRTQGEDPVIHFYEHFLSAYNKKLKVQRGVFYTPQPVVSYIVRSVHELLQTEFRLEDGLASTVTWGEMQQKQPELKIPEGVQSNSLFVQILDPATGTATFLVEVIAVIHRTLTAKWKAQRWSEKQQQAAWNEYVPKHLLPRLHGYELMMAPYAIAHMKVGLKLHETGYRFQSEERVRVYLTNALEPASDAAKQQQFEALAPALAHEAMAVNEVKKNQRFTLVIGNPPYSNFGQMNKIPWILSLLEGYKCDLSEKKLNLDDDFIKFICFSQHSIDRAGVGIFAMITNNSFIDGITHRQMRKNLLNTFNRFHVLNLHGSSKKKEKTPDGLKDDNVFDIQQGVAVTISVKLPISDTTYSQYATYVYDLWGERTAKYATLASTSVISGKWIYYHPVAPYFFFTDKSFDDVSEYEYYMNLKQIFVVSGNGIKTERDRVSIHFKQIEIETSVHDFQILDEIILRRKYDIGNDSRDWTVNKAKTDVIKNKDQHLYREILYRPFDFRHTWYSGQTRGFIGTPAFPTMRNMFKGNIAIVTTRQTADKFDSLCTNRLVGHKSVAGYDINTAFPLYIIDENPSLCLGNNKSGVSHTFHKRPNFSDSFVESVSKILQLPKRSEYGLPGSLTPEDIFYYIYAIFHSSEYCTRYAEFLKIDFPRLPLTSSLDLFLALSKLGSELVALHLMESPKLDQHLTTYTGPTAPIVEKVSYANDTVWLDKAQKNGFVGVPENVWNFHIGGYQVCNKWLKDRKGRTLSADDLNHYHRIVIALSETIRLMAEIDEVIEQNGGWPGAFSEKSN
jgi:hypothetical protein